MEPIVSQTEASALSALRTAASDRTKEDVDSIVRWCKEKQLDSKLGGSINFGLLCRAMALEEYHEGEVLFRQGDEGHTYYIIFRGAVAIYVLAPNSSSSVKEAPEKRGGLNWKRASTSVLKSTQGSRRNAAAMSSRDVVRVVKEASSNPARSMPQTKTKEEELGVERKNRP